jgi:hypothetical protein
MKVRSIMFLLLWVGAAGVSAQVGPVRAAPDVTGIWAQAYDPAVEGRYNFSAQEKVEFRRQMERVIGAIHDNAVFKSPKGIDVFVQSNAIGLGGGEFDPATMKGRPRARGEIAMSIYPFVADDVIAWSVRPDPQRTMEVATKLIEGDFITFEDNRVNVKAGCVPTPSLKAFINYPDIFFSPQEVFDQSEAGKLVSSFFTSPRKIADISARVSLLDSGGGRNVILAARADRDLFVPVTYGEVLTAVRKYYEAERARALDQKNDGLAADCKANLSALVKKRLEFGSRLNEAAFMQGDSFDASSFAALSSADAKDARSIVRFNPSYFDDSLPRTAVQLLSIHVVYGSPWDKDVAKSLDSQRLKEAVAAFASSNLAGLLDTK